MRTTDRPLTGKPERDAGPDPVVVVLSGLAVLMVVLAVFGWINLTDGPLDQPAPLPAPAYQHPGTVAP